MLFSLLLPLLTVGVGGYLLVFLRFFFIRHPLATARVLIRALKKKESRRSLSLALAGTLGVGNIFGVAAGIIIGGEGSVFWLLVSSLFAAAVKYSEVLLSFSFISEEAPGMCGVLLSSYKGEGRARSFLYAAFCILLSVSMGGVMQSRAVFSLSSLLPLVSPYAVLFVFVALSFLSVFGGGDKIEKITAIVIPLTTVVYIILSLSWIFTNLDRLPEVLLRIISGAFSLKSAGGGIISYCFLRALKEGFARGVLSNESGCGTSSFAHVRAPERTPYEAGVFGICEIFFDTVILCPLTAFVILLSVEDPSLYKTPMSLVGAAFSSSLGQWSLPVLTVLVFLFAFSTAVSQYYYGSSAFLYLSSGRVGFLFTALFFGFLCLGARLGEGVILALSDTSVLALSVLTLFAIIRERKKIRELIPSSLI